VVFLGFGRRAERLARFAFGHAGAVARAGYDPNQPRVPTGNPAGGQWRSQGDQGETAVDGSVEPVAGSTDDIRAKKERFVHAHFADAQKAAHQLGVPIENILGPSALESEWGTHRFATEGNNFFGIHARAPFATGYMVSLEGVKVATFASYADSLRSFVQMSGPIVQNMRDPADFAAALQNSGKFGINKTGSKVATYVGDVARTILGLRSIVARRSP
jgi:flagellum-specific peptidoglycan hydrolase FlgJ